MHLVQSPGALEPTLDVYSSCLGERVPAVGIVASPLFLIGMASVEDKDGEPHSLWGDDISGRLRGLEEDLRKR
jgi:hypothetical protein